MKKLFIMLFAISMFAACAPEKPKVEGEDSYEANHETAKNAVAEVTDISKGIGQIQNVELKTPLETERIGRGKAIYEMKCQACHRLDETRVVGPGWKGVTEKRKPEWIMNMILNVDVMLDQDPEAQKLLELCLMRMPNQNVSVGDARDIVEFMRQNDGAK
ncbi:MAG TPA: cytochrome c [Chryseolinea sp.]|nr:cytochrome c [Chryseolinea sp.]HPM30587.1 cytochrome c [Chryseolinea sp.]